MTRISIAIIVLALAGLAGWRIYDNTHPDAMRDPHRHDTTSVDVVAVAQKSVPVVLRLTGHAQTEHSVAVRARVGGVLEKVLFHEGDEVARNQLLFVIDPAPYRIQVAQSEGQVKQDEAKLEADEANDKRLGGLTHGGFVSAQDVENARAQVKEDRAAIATDKAKLAEARIQLGYTRIRAPIGGKTGAIAFKSGNLIQVSDATPLVTINQLSPILVQFDVPQSQLPAVRRYYRDGAMTVTALQADGTPIERDGKLVFIDNGVNQSSGTVSLKARFPNPRHQIWPGQLMMVDLTLTTEHNVNVVPTIAVQPGQQGSYVYAVQHGKVRVRNVTVRREYRGMSIITGDLHPGDLVVVRVPRSIRDGISVSPNVISLKQAMVTADNSAP